MEKYKLLFSIIIAFITAVWSYVYYAEYQTVIAENMIKTEKEIQKLEKQKKEVKAQHILVKSFEKAEELRNRIIAGESFEELAKEFSICPSGQKGGDLGFFRRGRMVPEFEQAAFKLEKDEISEPVKTDFGWHLIKVTDIVY